MWLQAIFVVLMVCTQMNVGHDHGHAHGSHGHTHGSHGHTHGSHGHAHGSHGHAHGSHGHAHGSHGHTHGQKHIKEEHHDHGHDDDHGHDHAEEPHFKWSKKANVKENEHDSSKLKDPAKHHEESNKHINHIHAEGHGHSHSSYENDKQKKQSESHLHSQSNSKDVKVENTYTPPISEPVLWFEPLLATGLISAAPFLILFVVPINSNSEENKPFLKVLLAFASGGLLGDALLHLIPHAISPHSHGGDISKTHSHSHNHIEGHDHSGDMLVGMWVLIGLITFLVVEKLVRHVKGGHGHSHASHTKSTDKKNDDPKETKVKEETKKDGEHKKKVSVKKEDIKVTAYLNLAADCTHNFTDGLAIGVSFLVSRNVGFITTLTIFLHEIPHEIGDFAILIQSGCTKRKAMSLQLVTAVGAFAGCICGLLAEGLGTAASSWILPFTAGGFIYIATVSVIPELLEETNIKQSIKEIFALLVGVLLMVIIATME